MIHVCKQLDLAQSPFCINPVIERIRDSLNRHLLHRLCIGSRAAAEQYPTKSHKSQTELPITSIAELQKLSLPNETVSAAADGSDRRCVFGGDLEEISEDVVLNESSAMDRNAFHLDS